MDEINKSLLWRIREPGLLEELWGMLFCSAMGHLVLLVSLGIWVCQPSGLLPPPVYRVNLVEFFQERSPKPPAAQPPGDASNSEAPTPAVSQVVRPTSRTPKPSRAAEIRPPVHIAQPKSLPPVSPATPSSRTAEVAEKVPSPSPSVEKRPRSSKLGMIESLRRQSGGTSANREAVASMLQPAPPPPAAPAEPKALEGLLKEGFSHEDLPSLPPSPGSLASGPKERPSLAPVPKGLTASSSATPAEVKKGRGSALPSSWLTTSGGGEKGQRPSTGALASLPRPEGEEMGLSRSPTPLSKGTHGAGTIQPKASTVILPSSQPASGEGKKGPERGKIAPYLLGEAANSASAGSTSPSQRLPALPPPPEKAEGAFTSSAPMARGGISPKGVGLEPLLSQQYVPLDTQDPQWVPYIKRATERIMKAWRSPEKAEPGLEGAMKIDFTVERDGSITQIKIVNSSGYPFLDHAAIETLQRASPLQPLPSGQKSVRFGGKLKFKVLPQDS